MVGQRRQPLVRVMEFGVSLNTPCILWTGGRSMGYGITYRGGRPLRAHQAAWFDAGREQPPGFDIHHRCENPLCWNLKHLELIPHAEHSRLHAPPVPDACPNGHPFPESLRPGRRSECAVCARENRRKPPRPPSTHCKHGHEYTAENTSILPGGARRCLTCHRKAAARIKARDPERVREINRRATRRYYECRRRKATTC